MNHAALNTASFGGNNLKGAGMITINVGQVGVFSVTGADKDGNPAPFTGGSATISDYDSAYVASTGKANEYMVVNKVNVAAGQKISLTVKFSGAMSVDGTAVAELSVDLELDGAPQPQATQLLLGGVSTPNAADVTIPLNPGSATIPMA